MGFVQLDIVTKNCNLHVLQISQVLEMISKIAKFFCAFVTVIFCNIYQRLKEL